MSMKHERAVRKVLACEADVRHAPSNLLRDKFRRSRDSWIRIANTEELVESLSQQHATVR